MQHTLEDCTVGGGGEEVPCRLMCAVGGAWTYRLAQSLCNKRGEVSSTRQRWGTGRGKGKVPNHPAFACPVRAQMWTGGAKIKKKKGVPCLVAAVFEVWVYPPIIAHCS